MSQASALNIRGIFRLEVNFEHMVATLIQDEKREILDLVLRIGNSNRLVVHDLFHYNSFCFDLTLYSQRQFG